MNQVSNWLKVAGLSLAAITSALAIWSVYYEECPCPIFKAKKTPKRTPFHGQIPWESSQQEKERLARQWMERYVKGYINRSKKSLSKDCLEKNLAGRRRGSSFNNEWQSSETTGQVGTENQQGNPTLNLSSQLANIQGEEAVKSHRSRADSLSREGTGRY